MNLIDTLWRDVSAKLFITREQFDRDMEGWDVQPIELDGETVGIALRKGPEFHFRSLRTGRHLTRQLLRDLLRPQLEQYGYVTTRTPKDEARQRRFNETVGFKVVGEDKFDIHYKLERESCRQ